MVNLYLSNFLPFGRFISFHIFYFQLCCFVPILVISYIIGSLRTRFCHCISNFIFSTNHFLVISYLIIVNSYPGHFVSKYLYQFDYYIPAFMFNLVISYHFSHICHSYNLAISNHYDGFPQIILGHFVSNLSHFEQTYKRWTEERTDTRTSDVKHKHSDNTSLSSCMKNDQGAMLVTTIVAAILER